MGASWNSNIFNSNGYIATEEVWGHPSADPKGVGFELLKIFLRPFSAP